MRAPLSVLPDALVEAEQAVDYLNGMRPGLGDAFTAALEVAFDRIAEHPEIGANADFGYASRRWRLARFPYSIIYVVQAGAVVVVAIAHDRRRPAYWARRR